VQRRIDVDVELQVIDVDLVLDGNLNLQACAFGHEIDPVLPKLRRVNNGPETHGSHYQHGARRYRCLDEILKAVY
jgi:hypothetical protein